MDDVWKSLQTAHDVADSTVHPWSYAGTFLLIFPLHHEDTQLPSANLQIAGATKIWIGITDEGRSKLFEVVGKQILECHTVVMVIPGNCVNPWLVFPPEIMCYIFEFIYTPSRSRFQFDVIFTQVSHLWCQMAISTPKLWKWDSINLRRPIPEILAFWDCMDEHVQGIPPIVVLRSIGEGNGSALAACPLISFPKISSLKLVTSVNYHLSI
jgi:JmjC domain, hydroxylase